MSSSNTVHSQPSTGSAPVSQQQQKPAVAAKQKDSSSFSAPQAEKSKTPSKRRHPKKHRANNRRTSASENNSMSKNTRKLTGATFAPSTTTVAAAPSSVEINTRYTPAIAGRPQRATLSNIISRLPEPQAQRAQRLLTKLKQELRQIGHSGYVREDSQLAISFISGRLDRQNWNLRTVATEIAKTSRLYEETNFAQVSRRIVADVIASCSPCVRQEDMPIVQRTAIHFLVPALKSVYTQLFPLMDAANEECKLVYLQQQHNTTPPIEGEGVNPPAQKYCDNHNIASTHVEIVPGEYSAPLIQRTGPSSLIITLTESSEDEENTSDDDHDDEEHGDDDTMQYTSGDYDSEISEELEESNYNVAPYCFVDQSNDDDDETEED